MTTHVTLNVSRWHSTPAPCQKPSPPLTLSYTSNWLPATPPTETYNWLTSRLPPLRKSSKLRKLTKMKKWIKIEGEVKGEQGLAALAFRKFEEEYKI
jgi:hypothetical protein